MNPISDPARLDRLLEAADQRHRDRRRRTARIYRMVERVFFIAIILLTILVLAKFAAHVHPAFPEYFG